MRFVPYDSIEDMGPDPIEMIEDARTRVAAVRDDVGDWYIEIRKAEPSGYITTIHVLEDGASDAILINWLEKVTAS